MMKSVAKAKMEYDESSRELANKSEYGNDREIFTLINKSKIVSKARRSEAFAYKILPQFLPLVLECVEKGSESYYITTKRGKKYIYYPTSSTLHTIVNGKHTRKIKLLPNQFLKYFSFLRNEQ